MPNCEPAGIASTQYAIFFLARQRPDEQLVGERQRVEQRRIHPAQQTRIARGIRRVGREDAGCLAQRPVNLTVDRGNASHHPPRLIVGPEGEPEHRANGAARTLQVSSQVLAKRAVIGDGGRDERMRDLQQDGATPAEKHHSLAVDLPRNARIRLRAHSRYLTGLSTSASRWSSQRSGTLYLLSHLPFCCKSWRSSTRSTSRGQFRAAMSTRIMMNEIPLRYGAHRVQVAPALQEHGCLA